MDDANTIVIDCDQCEVRGDACADCVVSVLLEPESPESAVEWDDSERRAIDALAEAGMIPRLRSVPTAGQHDETSGPSRRAG